jgi:hypothetical protein
MQDKDTDIRNNIVDCEKCKVHRIYPIGNMIAIETKVGSPVLYGPGTLSIQQRADQSIIIKDLAGNVVTVICDFSYIRKENNDFWGTSYKEVVTELANFFFDVANCDCEQGLEPTVASDDLRDFDTFLSTALQGWSTSTFSGGSIDLNQLGESGIVGIARLQISASTNARYGFLRKQNIIRTFLDCKKQLWKTRIRMEALPSSTGYFAKFGYTQNVAAGLAISELCFASNFSSTIFPEVTAGNWHIISRTNSTNKLILDTGVPVSVGSWVNFAIELHEPTNTFNFYINGNLVGSINWNGDTTAAGSNLPMVGGGTECAYGFMFQRISGTGSTGMRIDFSDFYKKFI